MDPRHITEELRLQLRERPYWTLAAVVGVGWILGRSLPLRAALAVGSIGARMAIATALDDVVADCVRPRAARTEEAT